MYTIGIDFCTLSGQTLLVDTRDGTEVATAVFNFKHSGIDQRLTGSNKYLSPEWASQ